MRAARAKILGTVLAVALVPLCAGSAFDRIADTKGPSIEIGPAGPALARRHAREAIAGSDGRALAWARRAVASDPVNASSLSLLGVALLKQGQAEAADDAFRVAAQLGWRDLPTQIYWAAQANALGDSAAAAVRIDAMMRAGGPAEGYESSLQDLESTPAGRDAIVARLRAGAPWGAAYLAEAAAQEAVSAERLDVITRAARAGVGLERNAVATLLNTLVQRGRSLEAAVLWTRLGPSHADPRAALTNGGFESRLDDHAPGPFDWQLVQNADVDAGIDAAPDPLTGSALAVTSFSNLAETAGQQLLVLPPGSYRLAWRYPPEDNNAPLSVTVSCFNSNAVISGPSSGPSPGARSLRFKVPQQACPVQVVRIIADSRSEGGRKSYIDDIVVSQ